MTAAASASYVLASRTPWALEAFAKRRAEFPGRWTVIVDPADLTVETLAALQPRYVFFPHWSAIIPAEIVDAHDCVCFHMTDLPYGRGGSPLQNLIMRGHDATRLTALRMDAGVDTGPIYGKRDLSLEGTAQDIYRRAAEVSLDLMAWIVAEEPCPTPQTGEAAVFKRRKPADSALPGDLDAHGIMRFIQMLDAEGYPPAFLDHGDWRLMFDAAEADDGGVAARVRFQPRPGDDR